MDNTRFLELKKMVFKAKDFGPIWNFFMDHFGENEQFLKMGRRAKEHVILDIVLDQLATQWFKVKKVSKIGWVLTEIPEWKFTHGAGFLNGCMTSIFHFDDEEVGMFAVTHMKSSRTDMGRFSTKIVSPPKHEPSLN